MLSSGAGFHPGTTITRLQRRFLGSHFDRNNWLVPILRCAHRHWYVITSRSLEFAEHVEETILTIHISGLIWHKNFKKGPFNLGRFSRPIALVGTLWICFITIIFCLPNVSPIDSQTLNYTPVAVGIVLVATLGSWFLWARTWFVGPIRHIEAEHLGVDVDEPGALERAEAEGKLGSDAVKEA